MKKINTIFFGLAVMFTIASCHKEPVASFTTNLDEYIAGDIVHLTNTSQSAHSYKWTMPDGQKVTTKNADYQIPANLGFGTLTFILEADSKNERKTDWISKSVNVIPASTFCDSTFCYKPLYFTSKSNGNNWWIYASDAKYTPQGLSYTNANAFLSILLPGTTSPAPGIYSLQSNDTLTSGKAYIHIARNWWEDNKEDDISLSGQLEVNISNGKIHVVFSNVDAVRTINGSLFPNVKISGDITVP